MTEERCKKTEIKEELKKSEEKIQRENLDKEDELLIKGGTANQPESIQEIPGDGMRACC